MAYTRKDYTGAPASTTLSAGITSGATTVAITSSSGWPSGTNGPFYAVVDPGTASEEKVLVTTRTGTTLNTVTRGVDGSTASAHDPGATIYPCFTAVDADEANYAVAQTVGKVSAASDLLVASGANAFSRLAKGSNSTVLGVDSGGTLGYTTITNAMVNSSAAISLSKLETISTGYVVGNNSGSTAVPTPIAISSLTDGFTVVTKGSNESVTSSTTVQNDDELLFTATDGTGYAVDFCLVYANAAGTNPDIKFDLGEDSTTRGSFIVDYLSTADTATSTAVVANQTATIAAGTTTTKRVAQGWGWHTGAGGTFRIRWAQNSSNGTATIVYAGSYLRYKAVG